MRCAGGLGIRLIRPPLINVHDHVFVGLLVCEASNGRSVVGFVVCGFWRSTDDRGCITSHVVQWTEDGFLPADDLGAVDGIWSCRWVLRHLSTSSLLAGNVPLFQWHSVKGSMLMGSRCILVVPRQLCPLGAGPLGRPNHNPHGPFEVQFGILGYMTNFCAKQCHQQDKG